MHLAAERRIGTPIATLWAALSDPDVIAACLFGGGPAAPGAGEGSRRAPLAAPIAGSAAPFEGRIRVEAADPPTFCRLAGSAEGGPAGRVRGTATIRLTAVDATTTRVAYAVEADLAGALARIDPGRAESAARDLAAAFFRHLETHLAAAAAADPAPDQPRPESATNPAATPDPPPDQPRPESATDPAATPDPAADPAPVLPRPDTAADPAPPPVAADGGRPGLPPLIWVPALILLTFAILLVFSRL